MRLIDWLANLALFGSLAFTVFVLIVLAVDRVKRQRMARRHGWRRVS